ncbi:hypothetical protein Pint_01011 [Pistacia integerrima]|uniref:Uncharacterized protein n=2 Tax=Pistacia TaxID=55512 RepID=A0ACC1C4X2_9ROSI|nr:hypothetical protein Pint_01011 [Pistacia integerrima]KAJ0110598.1 hypothetical protein Patl1_01036 [Pistacia atlantica]
MKHQHVSGDHHQDSKRTIGEKLREALKAARVAVAGDGIEGGHNPSFTRRNERRKPSYRAEDPIRTMMFLGSWSHT